MTAGTLETEVAVIGAGVAGCSAAIALRQAGVDVTILEQSAHRPQRFCGDFISGEALDSLADLNMLGAISRLGPTRVRSMALYGTDGNSYRLPLAHEGLGLSRRALDSALLNQAADLGAGVLEGARVTAVSRISTDRYRIQINSPDCAEPTTLHARAVIGAHGRRSTVDRILRRSFLAKSSGFVGVKCMCHCPGVDLGQEVALYLFPGGYGGAVRTAPSQATPCLLAKQDALRKSSGDPQELIRAARDANPSLAAWLERTAVDDDSILTISQVPFGAKDPVVDGVFMVGDSAGVMPPFLGIGIANAVRSATACGGILARVVGGAQGRDDAEREYESWWRRRCRGAQRWGRLASDLLCYPAVGDRAIRLLNRFPRLGERIYRGSRASTGPPVALTREPVNGALDRGLP